MKNFITGIGGLFFRSKDPKALGLWYEKHFGINQVGSAEVWNQESGPTVFSPFKEDTTYFGRKEQQFMINFRVTDLEALLQYLAELGVRIEKNEDSEYGKFAWVYDPEGNKIELWEPKAVDS